MSYRTFATAFFSLVLVASLAPVAASAQQYNNCYSNGYSNQYCGQGSLVVTLDVLKRADGTSRSVTDFTVYVNGSGFPRTTFQGNGGNGTSVNVWGPYAVTVLPLSGYNASYSSGCTGSVYGGQSACVVTETPSQYVYVNNPTGSTTYVNGSTYPNVAVTQTYVPRLPNTGFAPMDAAALATVLAVLFAVAFAAYPYVRKAFTIVLK